MKPFVRPADRRHQDISGWRSSRDFCHDVGRFMEWRILNLLGLFGWDHHVRRGSAEGRRLVLTDAGVITQVPGCSRSPSGSQGLT